MRSTALVLAAVLAFAGCKKNGFEEPTKITQDDVLLQGTLQQGAGDQAAMLAVNRSVPVLLGFGTISWVPARIDPAGTVVYGAPNPMAVTRLWRHVPDPLAWNAAEGRWQYPQDPLALEEEVSTPGCAEWTDVGHWVMQGGTGAVLYQCGGSFGPFYDEDGGERGPGPIYAWNRADRMLTHGVSYEAVLLEPDGSTVTVTGLPGGMLSAVTARAHDDGFRVVFRDGDTFALYAIADTGLATKEGTYAARPDGTTCGDQSDTALGADGVLYQTGTDDEDPYGMDYDVVCRRPLEPGTSHVVYEEAGRPDWDFEDRDSLIVKAHGPRLVTGP